MAASSSRVILIPAETDDNTPVILNDISIKALNISCRNQLSLLLNPEQLTDIDGYNRDFRGLAERLGFAPELITLFVRDVDPMTSILKNWEIEKDATIGALFDHLEFLDRHDVIDKVRSIAERNAREYLRRQAENQLRPVQDSEITSDSILQSADDSEHLTIGDAAGYGPERFDAFVCYADEDFSFVREMTHILEQRGLHLCLKERDVLPSRFEYDSIVRIIEERCTRLLIVLSPDFLKSSEGDFFSKFATCLSVEIRKHKIVPLLYKQCEMPSIMKYLCRVDYTRAIEWFWDRLIIALKQGDRQFMANHMQRSQVAFMNGRRPLPAAQQYPQLPPPYQTQANPTPANVDYSGTIPTIELPMANPTPANVDYSGPIPTIESPTPTLSSTSLQLSTVQSVSDSALNNLSMEDSVRSDSSAGISSSQQLSRASKPFKPNKMKLWLGKKWSKSPSS